MATSTDWCRSLSNHKIFEIIRQHEELRKESATKSSPVRGSGRSGKSSRNGSRLDAGPVDAESLLVEKNGEVFLWNSYTLSVLTTSLKTLAFGGDEDSSKRLSHQELTCTDPPVFEVNSITFNRSGSHLALIGLGGASVLKLPERRGKFGQFEDGKAKIFCKTVGIDERFFATSGRSLLQALWHPGCSLDSRLTLLTSDNVIRIYNIDHPEISEHVLPLTPGGGALRGDTGGSRNYDSPRGSLNVRPALGESAVSFDFGPAVEGEGSVGRLAGVAGGAGMRPDVLWPVYALMGNGEVYRLLTAIGGASFPLRGALSGPLRMHPAAEDNYGMDACFLSCLATLPPLVVIATCEGKLHHCLLLGGDGGADDELHQGGDMDSTFRNIPQPSLFVYEAVELEMSLSTISVDTEELQMEDFSCPIKLHKDPMCAERYHAVHSAGLHSLALPWITALQEYCADEAEMEMPVMNADLEQAIVEHLLCTKPMPSSPPSPVLGVCLVSDRLLGSKVICLTATLQCVVLPLLHGYGVTPTPLLSSEPRGAGVSPLRRRHKEPFNVCVQKILRRDSSNPLLHGGFGSELTPQECFELLSRVTQVFREEYVQKQDLARLTIERRIRVLTEQKAQQQCDVEDLKRARHTMERAAQELTLKHTCAASGQERITARISTLLKRLQQQLPMLSDAEKDFQRELCELEECCCTYDNQLRRLVDKKSYQDRVIKMAEEGLGSTGSPNRRGRGSQSPACPPPLPLSSADMARMKAALTQEGDDIASLVEKIGYLNVHINS